MINKVTVLGAGSWGTAIAISLSTKGVNVNLWDINESHVNAMIKERKNSKYLPGVAFPDSLNVVPNEIDAIKDAEVVIFAVPAQFFRGALENIYKKFDKNIIVVNVAKGIEQKSLMRLSEIANEIIPELRYVVISGPSHAEEVCRIMPTTLVAASEDHEAAEIIQDLFMSKALRVYTNDDVIGVELGGALKNIIALGAGISDGLGYGDNAKAAMMTRGLAEIKRLGLKMGASENTFAGLSGIGDLIVTCTSMHSRNRRCGLMIGQGDSPKEAIDKVGMIVEGVFTCDAAYQLSQKYDVEMPIVEKIYQILNGGKDAREAVDELMTRQKKHENERAVII